MIVLRTHAAFTATALAALSFVSTASTPSSANTDGGAAHARLFIVDERGEGIDARVRIRPETWADRMRAGRWRDFTVLAEGGQVDLELTPGRYRVLVSRGPEWSITERSLSLAPGDEIATEIALKHEVFLPGWLSADLHVHTKHSEDAAEHGGVDAVALRAEGIDVAAVTDHNRISHLEGMDSVSGAELTSWNPEIGHFNAFPLTHIPAFQKTTPARLFAELHQNPETFVQINHPRLEGHIAYLELGEFDGETFGKDGFNFAADGIEVWNGYDIGRLSEVNELLEIWRGLLRRGHHLTATGGSDCHGRPGHMPGYPRTYVHADSSEGLAAALKRGRAFVTNGPLLELTVNGQLPGDVVTVDRDGKIDVHLVVKSSSYLEVDTLELWLDEDLIWSTSIEHGEHEGTRHFETDIRLAVPNGRSLHAVARGGDGLTQLLDRRSVRPFAFTNPVYIRQPAPQFVSRAP